MSHKTQQQVDDDDRWSKHLPDEVIEMTVKRLTLVDSIRFAAVCPSWRRVSSQWIQRVTRLPWLLKTVEFLDSETVNYSLYSLYSSSEDIAYDLKFPRESACSDDILCSGSTNGWLIMSEYCIEPIKCTNYLLNPITGDRIKLPQVTGFIPHVSTASSDPRSPDCIVATKSGLEFIFCRPGSQRWSRKTVTAKPELDRMDYMKFHEDGKLYVIGRDCDRDEDKVAWDWGDYYLLVFVPLLVGKDEEITWDKQRVIKLAPRKPWTGVESITEPWLSFAGPAFTLSSKGKLLLFWKRNYIHKPDPPVFPFHVVKIDDGWPGWENSMDFHVVRKDNIWAAYDACDNELVLISHYSCISVPKSNKSFTRPTIDERFFSFLCGKLNTLCWDTTENGLLDNNEDGRWFTPNIAK